LLSNSTFKACNDDREISKAMGPVIKCGAVPKAQRTDAVWPLAHKFCLDAEPTQAQWGAAKAAWDKQTADDKAAAAKKAADDAKKAAAAKAAGAAAAAKVTSHQHDAGSLDTAEMPLVHLLALITPCTNTHGF
jgi:membrane protein involved in colicin uptake